MPAPEPVESAEAKALRLLHEAIMGDMSIHAALKAAFLRDIQAEAGAQLREVAAIVDEAVRDGSH